MPAQIRGRTPEEAVQRARKKYGNEVRVRCWKTRTGGVLGFFAKETFVAGIEPPPGAAKAAKALSVGAPAATESASAQATRAEAATGRSTRAEASAEPAARTTLSQLVEETSDKVTLGADPVPVDAFSAVLAEAEAAVNGTGGSELPPSPAPLSLPVPGGPERIDGLTESLKAIGVPREYRPGESEDSLDGLVRALARLPQAQPLPTDGGSVILVIGAGREARAAAQHLVAACGLDDSDVLAVDPSDAGRQRVARRRAANRMTVLVVEGSLRSRRVPAVASWIRKVQPDYVLGAVPATAKRADVDEWIDRLGVMDALALSALTKTATPGELMGAVPISFLDGADASTLRWVLTLLRTRLEREP